jgi:hypothetical protein
MPASEEVDGMRRKHEPRRGFFLIVIRSANGIPRIKGPSYGIFSMGEKDRVKTSEFSL